MKKINLILIALMALIFVSCSEDETTMSIPQESNAIEFGTYLGRNPKTRGVELTTENIKTFGIFAAYTGQDGFVGEAIVSPETEASPINFMHNQLVSGGQNSWSYTPIKYWPTTKGDKISFFAYAPHTDDVLNVGSGVAEDPKVLAVSENSVAGTPKVTYTVPNDPTKMVDFVAGVVMNRGRIVGEETKTTVNFNLKHELTRVAFKAKANVNTENSTGNALADETRINIKSATFDKGGKFYKKGVYTFATENSTDGEIKRGVWELDSDDIDSYSIEGILNTTEITEEDVFFKETTYRDKGLLLEGSKEENLFTTIDTDTPGYLFLIPPKGITGLDASNEISVTFEYDIVTVDKNLNGGHSVTSAKKTVKLPAETLKQGTAYTYTFVFGVDEIKVSAKVDEWGVGTGGGTIDYGTPDVTP